MRKTHRYYWEKKKTKTKSEIVVRIQFAVNCNYVRNKIDHLKGLKGLKGFCKKNMLSSNPKKAKRNTQTRFSFDRALIRKHKK